MARILLVDDDADILLNLRLVLEAHGHEVHERLTVHGLLDDVRCLDPDLIVLDVMFPDDPEAGFKAARALAKDPDTADTPVLILSAVNQRSGVGFVFTEDDISDDFLPVQAFVDKPVEPGLLLHLIDEQLRGPRGPAGSVSP